MNMNVLLVLGTVMAAGFGGGRLFKKLKIPQVIGYIITGILLGKSFLGFLSLNSIDSLTNISSFALGLIGFMIGGELKFGLLRRLGKTIFSILIFESFSSFLLVAAAIFLLTHKLYVALIFGALASATAPAATVDVLWEYKSKGILTTTLLAIVALDDIIALLIYSFAASFAKLMITGTTPSFINIISKPVIDVGLAVFLGGLTGLIASSITRKTHEEDNLFPLALTGVLVCSGVANVLHLSQILANMVFGIVLTNMSPVGGKRTFAIMEKVVPPVFILFFVLVGARLQISALPKMGLIGVIYILARSFGKISGTFLGAKISNAADSVKNYLGLCLFSQAGVTVGLAMSAYYEFSHYGSAGRELGIIVISVITATTFIVQLLGPPCVKYAIFKADEAGKARRR